MEIGREGEVGDEAKFKPQEDAEIEAQPEERDQEAEPRAEEPFEEQEPEERERVAEQEEEEAEKSEEEGAEAAAGQGSEGGGAHLCLRHPSRAGWRRQGLETESEETAEGIESEGREWPQIEQESAGGRLGREEGFKQAPLFVGQVYGYFLINKLRETKRNE